MGNSIDYVMGIVIRNSDSLLFEERGMSNMLFPEDYQPRWGYTEAGRKQVITKLRKQIERKRVC